MNGVHRIARILVPVDGGGWTHDRLLENGQAYLRNVARAAKAGGVLHRAEIAHGDPSAVICETAADVHADVVVMGRICLRW